MAKVELVIVFKSNAVNWRAHLLGRVVGIALIIAMAVVAQAVPLVQFVHQWYPLATIALFYWELSFLATLVYPDVLDSKLIDWEERIFKCQPSLRFSERYQSIAFSEYLHLSYLLYYLVLVALPIQYYLSGAMPSFYAVVFAEAFVFYACLVCYIFFPIAGPRYMFPKNETIVQGGPICRYTHRMLENNSSKGTACPSSHVAMVSIVFFYAVYLQSGLAWLILPVWFGVSIGVVYCRFHYALDAILGLLMALGCFLLLTSVI
jgi:membrane-associated phospholipid phosphatase